MSSAHGFNFRKLVAVANSSWAATRAAILWRFGAAFFADLAFELVCSGSGPSGIASRGGNVRRRGFRFGGRLRVLPSAPFVACG